MKIFNLKNHEYIITSAGEQRYSGFAALSVSRIIRELLRIYLLVLFELKQQSFGLSLGRLWHVLEPVLQAGTYYFLLSIVFRIGGMGTTFSFFLIAIILWRSHAMLSVAAPRFMLEKGFQFIEQGFGMKLAFVEFVSVEVVLFSIRLLVMFAFLLIAGVSIEISWLGFIPVVLAMFLFTISFSIWLAIIGIYVKDISRLVGHFVWLWWYISPGLYQFDRIPLWAQPFFLWNPFTYIFPAAHNSLLYNTFSLGDFINMTVISFLSVLLIVLGWKRLQSVSYQSAKFV